MTSGNFRTRVWQWMRWRVVSVEPQLNIRRNKNVGKEKCVKTERQSHKDDMQEEHKKPEVRAGRFSATE
jgi:hypothetical protein